MLQKKTINVKFNSNFKLNGSTNDDAMYYIDWSAILKNDNQHYSVVWSYTSMQSVFDPDTKIASVYTNIYGENYIANSYGANVTLNIGSLIKLNGNTLHADTTTNPPIYTYGRPNNNNVNVQIRNNDNPPTIWLDQAGDPNTAYILTLSFTEL